EEKGALCLSTPSGSCLHWCGLSPVLYPPIYRHGQRTIGPAQGIPPKDITRPMRGQVDPAHANQDLSEVTPNFPVGAIYGRSRNSSASTYSGRTNFWGET